MAAGQLLGAAHQHQQPGLPGHGPVSAWSAAGAENVPPGPHTQQHQHHQYQYVAQRVSVAGPGYPAHPTPATAP
eukprot:8289173-Pyramimonas_sp.AAC.1